MYLLAQNVFARDEFETRLQPLVTRDGRLFEH